MDGKSADHAGAVMCRQAGEFADAELHSMAAGLPTA
jgi:hypothetical protein